MNKISPVVALYVRRRSAKSKKVLPENWDTSVSQIIKDMSKKCGAIIAVSWLWDGGGNVPNASATIPGFILLNAAWAYILAVSYDDPMVQDAFHLTIGHEVTHQEGDYFYIEPFTNDGKFVYWINEVHADYGGIEKAFEGVAERGIRALEFKRKCKGKGDRSTRTHPSWQQRIDFVKNYDFGEELIKKIATMTKCRNGELVRRVYDQFDDIKLIR